MVKRKKRGCSSTYVPVVSERSKHINDIVRPSVYLLLDDERFNAQFTEVFQEHVPGFTGLSKRKDKDKDMEWRVRLNEKRQKSKQNKSMMDKERLLAIARYKALKKAKLDNSTKR